MHIAPRAPPFSAVEAPNADHRYATTRIAAAEEPKIIVRFIRAFSTMVQSFLDVVDDVLRLYDLAIVFAYQPPIRSNQHHIDQVADRSVRLDLPTKLESGQRLIDVAGTSGQEIPSLLIRPLLT